jgi:hypothetical protein
MSAVPVRAATSVSEQRRPQGDTGICRTIIAATFGPGTRVACRTVSQRMSAVPVRAATSVSEQRRPQGDTGTCRTIIAAAFDTKTAHNARTNIASSPS